MQQPWSAELKKKKTVIESYTRLCFLSNVQKLFRKNIFGIGSLNHLKM